MLTITLTGILAATLTLAPPETQESAKVTSLYGFLTEQGEMFCRPGGDGYEWVRPRLDVGFAWVVATKGPMASFVGKPVVVTGRPAKPSPMGPIKHEARCPVPQMRSDWIWGKSGMRIQRASPPIAGFAVETVRELTELKATQKEDVMTVTFDRPKGVTSDITLIVHYEGCGGKPGSSARSETFAPGKEATMTVPRIMMDPRDRVRAARVFSVEVRASGPSAVFDLDVPVSSLGIIANCPNRRR